MSTDGLTGVVVPSGHATSVEVAASAQLLDHLLDVRDVEAEVITRCATGDSGTRMDEMATVFQRTSTIDAPLQSVWERIASPEGINDEMRPWLSMSAPRGVGGRQAGFAVIAAPHRVGDHELDERRHNPENEQYREDGQHGIDRA